MKTTALSDDEKKNVQVSTDYLPLEQDDPSNPVVGEKNEMLEEFERWKRARMINVSTDDNEIKKDLRYTHDTPTAFFLEISQSLFLRNKYASNSSVRFFLKYFAEIFGAKPSSLSFANFVRKTFVLLNE